jgi:hypothetical protein
MSQNPVRLDADPAAAVPPSETNESAEQTAAATDSAPKSDAEPTPNPKVIEMPKPVDAKPRRFGASIFPDGKPLPETFVNLVQELERTTGSPVVMLVQDGTAAGHLGSLGPHLFDAFFTARADLQKLGKRPLLLVHSPGGDATSAYKLAKLMRVQCGGFDALVPLYAKSAATLLVLGANRLVLGVHAELGPLDAQYLDIDREEWCSALDEVQALERLHAFALEAVDRSMMLMGLRTRKKTETLLPHVLPFVTGMMKPLLEKIDTVHYSQMSRVLKVAEEYAARLLRPIHGDAAPNLARKLVESYPEHGFVIDAQEAKALGLRHTVLPSAEVAGIVDAMIPLLEEVTAIGRLQELPDAK